MTKKEKFIQRVQKQIGVTLPNDKNNSLNQNRNVLYAILEDNGEARKVFNYLCSIDIKFEPHQQVFGLNRYTGGVWIWV